MHSHRVAYERRDQHEQHSVGLCHVHIISCASTSPVTQAQQYTITLTILVHKMQDLDKVAANVARLLTLCGRTDIPIYRGCEEPLMREPIKYDYFHGLDGLGDVPHASPGAADVVKQPEEDIACVGLLKASKQYEGRLVLIALGEC